MEIQETEKKSSSRKAVVEDVKLQNPLQIYSFSEKFMDETVIHFQFIFMKGSFVLWIGDATAKMDSLSISLQSQFDTMPSVSTLFGKKSIGFSQSLSQRLAKMSGMIVFVSCNVDDGGEDNTNNPYLESFIQQQVIKHFKLCRKMAPDANKKTDPNDEVKQTSNSVASSV